MSGLAAGRRDRTDSARGTLPHCAGWSLAGPTLGALRRQFKE